MNYRVLSVILTAVASLIFGEAMCQMMPERRLVRKGNRQYERQDFDASLDSYAKALQEDPTSFEAKFNTANGQFCKELIDKSEQTLRKLAQDSTRTDIERSEVVYNLGNALFVQQRLEEALECYRNAMRLNPDDKDAKFNYALTKELLKQQQQNQQQQQQQQDQNQNQDQNQDQDQQQQQQNQDQKEQENKQDEQEQPQEQPQNFSEQEQEAMLEAIQAQEDKTQDKLKDKKGVLIRGGKNW